MRTAAIAVIGVVAAWFGRRRLVAALTRTTGTWVGTPPPPTSGPS